MKKLFSFLTILIFVIESMFSQSIFSIIHLNDKEDVQHEYAKSIRWKLIDLKPKGRSISKGEMRLNHNNQVIYDFENDIDTSWQKTIITNYNPMTGLVESRISNTQNSEGFILDKEIFKYDTNNLVSEIFHFDQNMHLFQHTLIKNNEYGLPMELSTYNADEKSVGEIERAEYHYEENMYTSKIYSSDGVLISSNNEILNFNDNHKFKNSDIEYNESGDIIKCCISELGYIKYLYKYDRLSNWTEYRVYDITFSKNKNEKKNLITIFKRDIEYW